jgi:hypothetical protein
VVLDAEDLVRVPVGFARIEALLQEGDDLDEKSRFYILLCTAPYMGKCYN